MEWRKYGSVYNHPKPYGSLAYKERISTNITTLTTNNADASNGVINGLLYVPDLDSDRECDQLQYQFIPRNVTRRSNLPPQNYNLIALAPWFSIDCTIAYLASARLDPIRAFIFYKPNNSSNRPQDADSPVWNLEDGGAWTTANKYPIYAISGQEGQNMMSQLSYYSGSVDDIPYGENISTIYGPNPRDYVRIWTELSVEDESDIPPLWAFFLIVIGALLAIFAFVSITMHLVQRRRRISLRKRVESGEVDLEAMGIKRLTVPTTHINSFPFFTYNADPESMGPPPTPLSTRRHRSSRGLDQQSIRSGVSVRSKRSGATGENAATNFQPSCHICLTNFEHRVTIIRELPCGHIFHPECIDEFLSKNSSLCPMCKHSMLPRGYSPRITNGMVRRERALRKLRQRVDLEDLSEEGDNTKMKDWGKRLFRTSSSPSRPPSAPLVSLKLPTFIRRPAEPAATEGQEEAERQSTSISPALQPEPETNINPPAPVTTPKTRRARPKRLNMLPTQPENSELSTEPTPRRGSPSSFARQRMREIAAKNAPFDDPDSQRAVWLRALSKVFPGYF
ncbi:ring finger membrane [Fusarium longipes]|uniref:Ring finger membrane n=1 Tax=Fusarium longipes TaxID=694270 RepID=A0A395SQT9_9HYPO|nr:ring finger membrane [Fusarium longipes]